MGNFQFYYDFPSYTPTVPLGNPDPSYPVTNLSDYDHTRRKFCTSDTTHTILTLSPSSLLTVKCLFLNDVNFAVANVAFVPSGSPSSYWLPYAVVQDIRVGRYKMLTPNNTSVQYVHLEIPAQTTTDGLPYFRIGSAIIATSVLTFTDNPIYPYSFKADENIVTVDMESGAFEDVNVGPRIWEGTFGFESLRENESQIWTLNSAIPKATNCIFHENCGDTSKAYLCRRRTPIQVTWNNAAMSSFESMTFREVY